MLTSLLPAARRLAAGLCLVPALSATQSAAQSAAQPAGAVSDAGAGPAPLATIAALDVPRYMGTWFEIAKFPNRFQRQCAGSTRADYRLNDDGTVQVTNRCRDDRGALTEAVGQARQVGPRTSPRLQVRFAPAWLSFLPAVWGDYWVIDLDERYQLAAVSEPRREFLWILARTPRVDPAAYEGLRARLAAQGFDLGRLQPTPQD